MMVEGGLKNEVCLGFIARRYRVVRYSPQGPGLMTGTVIVRRRESTIQVSLYFTMGQGLEAREARQICMRKMHTEQSGHGIARLAPL